MQKDDALLAIASYKRISVGTITVVFVATMCDQIFDLDQASGELAADLDLDGLHAVIVALACGYSLYRKELARSAKVSVSVLDDKVETVLRRMFSGVQRR